MRGDVESPQGDMGEVETWEHLEPLLYLGRGLKAIRPDRGPN